MVCDAGCEAMTGAAHTVTVATALSVLPQEFVTRTQYVVDAPGMTVSELLFVPTGVLAP
jgi:hypothetical protein